jgi:hypothetical protein
MLGRLLSLARVSRRDPQLVALAFRVYGLLVLSRVVINVLPLRRITALLGTPMAETPTNQLDPTTARYARRVAWCIRRLSDHTPTESNCYPQALTARWLLRRRGIPTTIYYGAAFETGRPALQAHVWLRCGPMIVTGGGLGRRYQPLTYYADERPNATRHRSSRAQRSSRAHHSRNAT